MKRFGVCILSLVLAIGILSGCSEKSDGSNNKDETYSFSLGHVVSSQSHSWNDTAMEFAEAVEEESEGRIKIEVFPDGQLGGDLEMLQQIKMGDLDMGLISGAAHSPIVPEMGIESLPFVFEDNDSAYNKMDGELGNKLFELLEDEGIKGLAWWESGLYQITNNKKPINNPEDLEGLKIRVPESELRQETFKQLGASPVPMAFTELFSALQQGTIDGQSNPAPVIESSNFNEVQEYLSILNINWTSAVLEINLDTWNSLPEDLQEILEKNARKYRDVQRERIQQEDVEVIKELESSGMEVNYVNDLDPFKEKMEPIYDKYRNEFGDELMDLIIN